MIKIKRKKEKKKQTKTKSRSRYFLLHLSARFHSQSAKQLLKPCVIQPGSRRFFLHLLLPSDSPQHSHSSTPQTSISHYRARCQQLISDETLAELKIPESYVIVFTLPSEKENKNLPTTVRGQS